MVTYTITDDETYHHDYKFKVQRNCGAFHPKPIEMNQWHQQQVTGFRRSVNFIMKCKSCRRERYATISKRGSQLIVTAFRLIALEHIADDPYQCQNSQGDLMVQGVGLLDGEWGYVDESSGEEMRISDLTWEIEMVKYSGYASSIKQKY
ncbi:uncharacterized protein LODBEIA_P35960 [Lodderomyces beijingensis]|uniref:Uncharacterized protein n=1 Tax=Lodderomyces beijingensis TaxID=1775926 RepID=A0ABP0ZMK5_9ASCO